MTPRTRRRVLVLVATAGILVAGVLLVQPWHRGPEVLGRATAGQAMARTADDKTDQLYTCPMHPDVLQHGPGKCPICEMDLVPVKGTGEDAAPAAAAPPPPPAPKAQATPGKQLWTCGMHPQVIQDHPGNCPICGMKLTPLHTDAQATDGATGMSMPDSASMGKAAPATGGKRKILFYRNPMDPSITSPVPRKDDMGMDYVPVYADEAASVAKQGATVTIDPVVVQNMNVTMEPVKRQDVRREIRTVGYLDYDQEKIFSVTTKYPGYLENVHVNYIGQPVRKGDPLFEIYAPELVQTQQELLSARDYERQMQNAPADVAQRAAALYQAARTRLGYWDISAAQIDRLERTGEVQRTLTVTAPASGVIRQRMDGLDGMAAKPGMDLLSIADLSSLWLVVEVYESQLPWVSEGSEATITLDYFPGETFTGKVRYVEPQVAVKTRSVQLTLEIPNPDGRLRAGMYATVRFQPVVAHDVLTVPVQAVLRTGERDIVVVALGQGRFAPRDVVLGPQGDGFVQVLSGLQDGDQIVTSSQFLIDSESNLRAAIQKLIAERTAQH